MPEYRNTNKYKLVVALHKCESDNAVLKNLYNDSPQHLYEIFTYWSYCDISELCYSYAVYKNRKYTKFLCYVILQQDSKYLNL